MGLESATYISGLNSANPTTSDAKTEGDDHIRLLKSTILTTFPNITGAVTPTHTELNYVDGVTSAIQTQIDSKVGNANWSFNANRWINGGATQTAFNATLSGSQTSGTTVIWNSERFDQGSAYDHTTGVFTAPIGGIYLFAFSVPIWNGTGSTQNSLNLAISINGTPQLISGIRTVLNNEFEWITGTLVCKLSTNDTAAVTSYFTFTSTLYAGSGTDADTFSGYLLS